MGRERNLNGKIRNKRSTMKGKFVASRAVNELQTNSQPARRGHLHNKVRRGAFFIVGPAMPAHKKRRFFSSGLRMRVFCVVIVLPVRVGWVTNGFRLALLYRRSRKKCLHSNRFYLSRNSSAFPVQFF